MPPFTRPLPISSPKTQSRHRPNSPSRDRVEIRGGTIASKKVGAIHPPIPPPIGLARCAVSIAFPGATGLSLRVSISTRGPRRRTSSQTWNPRPASPVRSPPRSCRRPRPRNPGRHQATTLWSDFRTMDSPGTRLPTTWTASRYQERSQRSATRSLPLDSTSTRQLTSSGTPPTEKTEDFSHRQHSATHEAYPWSPAPTTTRSSSSEVGTYRQSAAHDRQHGWLTEGRLRGLLVRRVAFTSVEHGSLHRFGIDDPLMAF